MKDEGRSGAGLASSNGVEMGRGELVWALMWVPALIGGLEGRLVQQV